MFFKKKQPKISKATKVIGFFGTAVRVKVTIEVMKESDFGWGDMTPDQINDSLIDTTKWVAGKIIDHAFQQGMRLKHDEIDFGDSE